MSSRERSAASSSKDDRLVAQFLDEAVYPAGRVCPRQRIDVHRHFHQAEPTAVRILPVIPADVGRLDSLVVGDDLHVVKQVFPSGINFDTEQDAVIHRSRGDM